ncbi:hypothetical protein [Saccharothrix syringae]|uniref:Uncharacterized protein n=1 Tax=Saccharothrix syringae TaxID=103733 RepID=A0A5Q0H8M3_SACSY|nr:hypothetical protein [Saccharothrix syringae]QFZ22324.1 hypothetical protein EKG83_37295 [Saccharothrix syringae]
MGRAVGVVALVVGAVSAAVGTFLPLYHQRFDFGGTSQLELTQNSWRPGEPDALLGRDAHYGVPMAVAVLLLLVGAVFAGRAWWGRLVALGGAALLVGAVWVVGQIIYAYLGGADPDGIGSVTIVTEPRSGSYVLGAACVVAVAGAVLVQERPPRAPRPTGAVVHRVDGGFGDGPDDGLGGGSGDEDTETPPLGFPAPPGDRPRPEAP